MPIPQVPEAMNSGVIDGAVVPWEVVPSIRLQEMVRNHTEFSGSPTFYTASFVLAMNKAKYEGLAPELRQVIDSNSGQAAATMAARVWDVQGPQVEETVRRRGNAIVELDEAEGARWAQATRPVIDNWVRSTAERNVNGGALLEECRALIARYGQGVA
jgi:TRAP-type C4-dicarboxylate transport system substrate-binding protein